MSEFSGEEFKEIVEGKARLLVPSKNLGPGPASKAAIFFNPTMASNRDVSILYARCRARPEWKMLDALGGTGARGVRMALEVPVDMRIHINDRSESAFRVMEKNLEMNGLDDITATRQELFALLPTKKFDWIDIDPYGSPVSYLDQAALRVSKNGTLSITATDTAPLCGAHAKACKRRYMARPLNTSCSHETGLRILVGNAIRRAAVMDIALIPELAYYQGHFFRCYFRVVKGAKPADDALKNMGYLEFQDGGYSVTGELPEKEHWAGPLWLGDLKDHDLVKDMLAASDDTMSKETVRLLENLVSEIEQPPYHYHTDDMARLLKREPMKTIDAIELLRESGHEASGVHYNTKGFRTDAGFGEMKGLFSKV